MSDTRVEIRVEADRIIMIRSKHEVKPGDACFWNYVDDAGRVVDTAEAATTLLYTLARGTEVLIEDTRRPTRVHIDPPGGDSDIDPDGLQMNIYCGGA